MTNKTWFKIKQSKIDLKQTLTLALGVTWSYSKHVYRCIHALSGSFGFMLMTNKTWFKIKQSKIDLKQTLTLALGVTPILTFNPGLCFRLPSLNDWHATLMVMSRHVYFQRFIYS